MPRHVIRNGRVVGDIWQVVVLSDGELPGSIALPDGPLAVSLAVWRARRDELLARTTPIGIRLESADDPAEIASALPRLALVIVNFPKFADGRGYSIAYLLRRRLGYPGEIRATGDVQRDQIFYLARSGFDAFQLREGRDPQAALAALRDFSVTYQTAADRGAPRFRRGAPPRASAPERTCEAARG